MTELKVVKVAVENTAFSFDALFDYAVPQKLCDRVCEGCRVLVPFGRANVKKIAMVFEVLNNCEPDRELKSICSVIDSVPVMTKEGLDTSLFMAQTTFCPIFDAVKAQLPTGMNLKILQSYELSDNKNEQDIFNLDDERRRIYNQIAASKTPVEHKKLLEKFGYVNDDILNELILKNLIRKSDFVKSQIGDKTQKSVRISVDDFENDKLSEKQKSVLRVVSDMGEASVRDILYFTGVSVSVVNTLCKHGYLEMFEEQVLRIDDADAKKEDDADNIVLSETQQKAYDNLLCLCNEEKAGVSLLYGVTGSGKTQVFLKLVNSVVSMGKTAIVMVPEISLTPQTVSNFYKYFGKDVSVIHSSLSVGERLDRYNKIKNGEVKVVVGTRSAVFAPLSNLGLIVMDEEQESAYKSENSPRYHARDIAKFRCAKNNCQLLLASATPSIESYYYASTGKYNLLQLDGRYGNAVLPKVTVVDMSQNELALRDTAFSPFIVDKISENLKNGYQTILLYNRRGYHTVASCQDCKTVVTCPNCSIALTYHKKNNRLMCHYCGYSSPVQTECQSCHSRRLFYKGQGTQKIEDELSFLFPDARIMRMDLDTSSGRFSHKKQFDAFYNGEYDILIGTQMIAKGLNFPNVTLVGVLNADQMLYANDFRGYERAFSLITQVVGRSGRGDVKGQAVIQSVTPQNPVILLASAQDYKTFYEQEITSRHAMLYPPFCDLCVNVFVSDDHEKAKNGAVKFVKMIEKKVCEEYEGMPIRVLGPSPMNVVKVGGKYRYRIIIKCKNNKNFRTLMRDLLKEFQTDKDNKGVSALADMNYLGSM